jgi:hypothetical protein
MMAELVDAFRKYVRSRDNAENIERQLVGHSLGDVGAQNAKRDMLAGDTIGFPGRPYCLLWSHISCVVTLGFRLRPNQKETR